MWNLVCTCTVIAAARLVEPERIRNMVAPPKPATASTRPPIGYDTMDGENQVRAWLTLFGEKIAAADYADEMIAQGWDSLANMILRGLRPRPSSPFIWCHMHRSLKAGAEDSTVRIKWGTDMKWPHARAATCKGGHMAHAAMQNRPVASPTH